METALELVALFIGLAAFVALVVISLLSGRPRVQSPQDDGYVPGNYHPDHDITDGDYGA